MPAAPYLEHEHGFAQTTSLGCSLKLLTPNELLVYCVEFQFPVKIHMKSLQTGLRVLSLFAYDRPAWGVGALAEELGIGKSHASKILASLRMAGFLEQDPGTKEYSVGLLTLALGTHYLQRNALVQQSLGTLRRLADESGHTTTLCVLNEERVMHLASVEGPHFLDSRYRVGTWLPFHATAVGKILYAFDSTGLFESRLDKDLTRFTANTITDFSLFREHMKMVRREGFARTFGESVDGQGAVAVPVFGESQDVIAALGLFYPIHTVDNNTAANLVALLHSAARSISARLGASVYPFGNARDNRPW